MRQLLRVGDKSTPLLYCLAEGRIEKDEYRRRIEHNEREIADWEARTTETEQIGLELAVCIEAVDKIAKLWEISGDEDKQQLARSLFHYIVYDLDSQRIVDFQLKPWADRFIMLRGKLYEIEGNPTNAGTTVTECDAELPKLVGTTSCSLDKSESGNALLQRSRFSIHHDFRYELPNCLTRQLNGIAGQRLSDAGDPVVKLLIGDFRNVFRLDQQFLEIHQFRNQLAFLVFAFLQTCLETRGKPHLFHRIHQLTDRFLHVVQLGLYSRNSHHDILIALRDRSARASAIGRRWSRVSTCVIRLSITNSSSAAALTRCA